MAKTEKIRVGIRDSQLSKAQTNIFINEANKIDNIRKDFEFSIQTIKTTGDINKDGRLDQIGGKGLFIKEIEQQIIDGKIDIGVHSMKDVPAVKQYKNLEIICWLKRIFNDDALLTNSGKGFFQLPSGSVIGTSSVRRRAQILSLRDDLCIKILRGNVDTRIKKLQDNDYDAIILSLAGIKRLNLDDYITEVLQQSHFLPAACQGAIGIQALKNSDYENLFLPINNQQTKIECVSEREILKIINANCNSPISVVAKVKNEKITIKVNLLDHYGKKIYYKSYEDLKKNYQILAKSVGQEILEVIGEKRIEELNELKDDFNYTPKN